MSAFDYERARELAPYRFQALILAALMVGRADEVEKLKRAFPALAQELEARRRSPDGRTSAERAFDELEMPRSS